MDGFDSESAENFESSDKQPHSHKDKLRVLSHELMRPQKTIGNESKGERIGFVEEARNRRIGRKDWCVHWDSVNVNGREFPSQRADTSTVSLATTAVKSGSHNRGGTKADSVSMTNEPCASLLLVKHAMCDMCLMTFEASSVSGVITMKRILDARRDWGVRVDDKRSAAANLYDPAHLCMLCSQFFSFEIKEDGQSGLAPTGAGRSRKRIALTLESMTSNNSLPGKLSTTTPSEPEERISGHEKRQYSRDRIDSCLRSSVDIPTFDIDKMIEDNHFVVKETDLTRQGCAKASQSSTADGMDASISITNGQPEKPRAQDRLLHMSPQPTAAKRLQNESGTEGVEATVVSSTPSVFVATPAMTAVAIAVHPCSRTRRENQPWWEIDLGGVFPIRCIRIHHPHRRTEVTKAGTTPFVNIAPFWIMTAEHAIAEAGPARARRTALASRRFESHQGVTVWELGANQFATVVRVQAEGVRSLQLTRVEVIKSGGSQEARDRVQRRHIARENQQLDQHISDQPGDAVVSPWAHGREKRRVSEHTGTVQRLQQYYAKQRGELEACCGSRANSERSPEPRAVTNVMGPGTCPGGAVAPIGLGENSAVNAPAARLASSAMTPEGDSLSADGTGPEGHPSSRGVIGSLSRKGQGIQGGLQGEDVSQLLTRATVGYDWVDDFRAQETRVRGAFTERDMVGLEEVFFYCALGDNFDARAEASISDPCIRLDPGELCGGLRRLHLQAQTSSSSNKNRSSLLLAIRESPYIFQVFSSGVIETLPDAFVRAETQLPPAQRPIDLGWTHFLGVMALCLEVSIRGAGSVTPSAVARLFEPTRDDKLDFLTRKKSRLPLAQRTSVAEHSSAGTPIGGATGGPTEASHVTHVPGIIRRAKTAPAHAARWNGVVSGGAMVSFTTAGGGGASYSSAAGDLSTQEESSIDTGEDPFDKGAWKATSRRSELGSEVFEGRRTARHQRSTAVTGDRNASLKSLMRPKASDEVSRNYRRALTWRRARQREAMLRVPEPDVEPARAYKPCGLCQAPFPMESMSSTVSLKVLCRFLAKAGAPSGRFDRKASIVCALHRLPLCVFCSQFFDPDFPEGILPPDGCVSRDRSNENNEPAAHRRESGNLVPFFDDRFPELWSDTPLPSSTTPIPGQTQKVKLREVSPAQTPSHAVATSHGSSCAGKDVPTEGKRRKGATELRQAGDLVRSGVSVRDRLACERPRRTASTRHQGDAG